MMEKRGIIDADNTPAEDDNQLKQAESLCPPPLEDHVTKRAADAANAGCCGGQCKKTS